MTKNRKSAKTSKRKRTDTHDECLSFSRKEDCEYGYCCTTYTGNDTGIFGTIIILCRSQALSTLISDFSEQKANCVSDGFSVIR